MSRGTLTSIPGGAGFPAKGTCFHGVSFGGAVFEFRHFRQTATMTLCAAESRGEKCLNQFPSERVADDEAPEADHVQVVVLDALVRRKGFMNQARPNARHFVRGDRCPHSAATNGHAAIHLSARDCARQRHDKIRIIIVRVRSAVAEIDHLMAGRAQLSDELFLQFKSAMVGGDADALDCFRQSRQRSMLVRLLMVLQCLRLDAVEDFFGMGCVIH